MKRFLLVLLLPALILAGCKDGGNDPEDVSDVIFSITPASIPLDHTAQVTSATLAAKYQSGNPALSAEWTLSSDQAWLTFSLASNGTGAAATLNGTGGRTVYFVVTENEGETSRPAKIFVNGGSDALATVTQSGTTGGGGGGDDIITVAVTPAAIPALSGDAQTPSLKYLTVACTNDEGEVNSTEKWTLASSQTWLTLSLNENGSGAAASVNGTGSRTVYLVATENSGSEPRTAIITLDGGSDPVVSITQTVKAALSALTVPAADALNGITGYYGQLPSVGTSYVGAFWRAGQTGERVIVTNAGENAGAWTATVAWYDSKWTPASGDGVVLAAGDSTDPNVRTNAPGDAESYKVAGTAASVTGTVEANGKIIFRIGLTKEFTAYNKSSNPARYAVVKLSYAGNTKNQLIFLRQGEGADYVMRPGDKNGSGAAVGDGDNRSYARKFTVYNITASDAQWAAKPGGVTLADFPQLAVRGGTFTQYPTIGGGLFQGTGNDAATNRVILNPATLGTTRPAGFPTSYTRVPLWDASIDETCPTGYRRFQDGDPTVQHQATPETGTSATWGPVKGSEERQSLFLTPSAGLHVQNLSTNIENSAWGYYADGYFDRRPITDGKGVSPGTDCAVAASTVDAAFRGRLFFNPVTYASLFLPAPGYFRSDGNSFAGNAAYYWSCTSYYYISGSSSSEYHMAALYMNVGSSGPDVTPSRQSRISYAWSVRCIQEP